MQAFGFFTRSFLGPCSWTLVQLTQLTFYRVRSARDGERAPAAQGGPPALLRESWSCRERSDCTLFVWRGAAGAIEALQFLFEERYLDWTRSDGWRAGSTQRGRDAEGAFGRGKGVRTLRDLRTLAGTETLSLGLHLLSGATYAPPLDAEIEPLIAGVAVL